MRWFDLSEFDSPDKEGSGIMMKESTLYMLEKAREIAKTPFIITSGFRTREHNKAVGGVYGSSHTRGYAIDIACRDSFTRHKILNALIEAGFNRIGIAGTFIHADNDPNKPSHCYWVY